MTIFFSKKTIRVFFMLFLTTTIFFAVVNRALSQPFGVTQGSDVSKYNSKPTDFKFSYFVNPPNPHPSFDQYIAVSTPKTGICSIAGIGVTIKNDAYGTATRSNFEGLTNQLQSKYGKSREFDYLRSGSIWNEPKEWAMGVYKKERTLARFWDPTLNSTLSNNIKSIALEVKALNNSDTYINVTFEFNNMSECQSIMRQSQADAF